MRLLPFGLVLVLLNFDSVIAAKPHKRSESTHDYYVLEHDPRHGISLTEITRRLGVEVVERAGELNNMWVVRTDKDTNRARSPDGVLDALDSLHRRSSESLHSRSLEAQHIRRVASSVRYVSRQEPRQRVKRAPPPIRPPPNVTDVATSLGIADPEFPKQWHLINSEYPEHMMNVSRLWEMGITGQGVISALVDDGLDYSSEDLADNFYAPGSYDYNDHEDLPTPKLFDDHHGTRCAGQIAAVKNNVCGVGIAYNSRVAGLRILSGPISDIDEAAALNNNYQETALYSCSWGPPDDGKSMEAPSYLIERAMLNGIQAGRHGKGSVFVFASGNGAGLGDQCNFDGYTNSIFSVTVAAIDYKGLHPYYSESCAANLVVAYSSGSGNHIVTTDIKGKCSESHGGTSAAAPNAVGVYALALSVRPDLSWRDIQHLTVRTAEIINPEDPDWETTASGRHFSYKYGYGRLNGYELVMAARDWSLVKPQTWIEKPAVQIGNGTCDVVGNMDGGQVIVSGGLQHTITITQQDLVENNFEALEHVTIRVWISHPVRGNIEVELISPNGIKSILAAKRSGDKASTGFPGWRFMSVKHWDENPIGNWTIRIGDTNAEALQGKFLGWQISFFGAVVDPSRVKHYELPIFPTLLPSVPSQTTPNDPTATKTHPKPTDHLPVDHGSAPGEAEKPAFETGSDKGADKGSDVDLSEQKPSGPTASSMVPTPDEGWFAGMSNLVQDQKWLFGAVSLVVLFGIGVGVFFWRRAVNRRRVRAANYASLPANEDVAMRSMNAPRGTKELYDAFGENSDDEDANEHTRLRPEHASTSHLGFHSEFLDDEDASAAGTPAQRRYRDEPDDAEKHVQSSPTGSGSGSADGSWEHASQTR